MRGGVARFSQTRALQVFLAMTLHDLDEHNQAMAPLLRNLTETNSDLEIAAYKEAKSFYANHLDGAHSVR